jgi:hypothetical protein
MKTTVKLVSVYVLIMLTGFLTSLYGQIKVFDNGSVGIRYTTSTPASKFVYNSSGEPACDVYFYTGDRSSSGAAQKTVIATGTGSANHIYSIVGQAQTGSNNYLYGVYGLSYSSSAISYGRTYGVYGLAGNATTGYNYGLYGYLYGTNNGTAVYGTTSGDLAISGRYAGYFRGDVYVTGLLSTNTLTIRSSDVKFKTNIVTLTSSEAYDKVEKIRPTTYNLRQQEITSADSAKVAYLYDPDSEVFTKRKYGFIAQELQEVFPDLVYTLQDGTLGIDYTGLIPVIIQALQEQQGKIEKMEAVINELQQKVDLLSSPK